jgi:hypothetical protein
VMADDDDRMQCVCLGPKRAPLGGGERSHVAILPRPAGRTAGRHGV